MYLQLKKQNDYLIWIGLGFNTKHYRKPGGSVQTDEWVMYLIYQVHVQCVCGETCGNVTGVKCLLGEGMCVCARCEGAGGGGWGED